MIESDYLLHLAIESFNSVSLKVLFKQLLKSGIDIKSIFETKAKSLTLNSFHRERLQKIIEKYNPEKLQEVKELLKKKKTSFVSYDDFDYPARLKEINDPPIGLFCKGNKALFNHVKNIAIVGTRNPTYYGIRVTKEFARFLSENGVNIISGMASGIDAIAHEEALKKSTVAVLGTGVDVPFPSTNRDLYEKILLNNGLIISEYPLKTQGSPWNFPQRNRIISALSDGVIVVEGETQSGALITARFAIKQNKKLFAVPGPVTSSLSNAPNALIKSKVAELLTSPSEIFSGENNVSSSVRKKHESKMISELTDIQKRIYHLLSSTKVSVDELSKVLEIPIQKINQNLSILEIKGLVGKLYDGSYACT